MKILLLIQRVTRSLGGKFSKPWFALSSFVCFSRCIALIRSIVTKPMWLLMILFLITLPLVNPYLRGDGVQYYAYIRSLLIDRDLHFENEYARGDPAFLGWAFKNGHIHPEIVTSTGYIRNIAPVGSSILWVPFFLPAHGFVLLMNTLGWDIPADGYSPPYLWLCALGTAIYSILGLLLTYRVAANFFPSIIALLATVGIWFASSLPVYMYLLPFQAHALASFTVSLFIWYWFQTRGERTFRQWTLLGLAAGLMIAVYHINGVFLWVLVIELMLNLKSKKWQLSLWSREKLCGLTLFVLAILVALLPQFIIKWIIHGSPLKTGYNMSQFFWTSPRFWQVLLSSEHGLFTWTPIVALAVLGLFFLYKQDKIVALSLLGALVVFYYVVASNQYWHGISSFGSRLFVSCTPVFVLGLAGFLEAFRRKIRIRWAAALLVLLIIWNGFFIFQWGSNLIPNRGPISWKEMVYNQFIVVPKKLTSFAKRYFTDRGELIKKVEQKDYLEEVIKNGDRE